MDTVKTNHEVEKSVLNQRLLVLLIKNISSLYPPKNRYRLDFETGCKNSSSAVHFYAQLVHWSKQLN